MYEDTWNIEIFLMVCKNDSLNLHRCFCRKFNQKCKSLCFLAKCVPCFHTCKCRVETTGWWSSNNDCAGRANTNRNLFAWKIVLPDTS